MSSSATLAVLASLLLIGCTTKQQLQQFTPEQTALEKKDMREGMHGQ